MTSHQLEWLIGTLYGVAGPFVWATLIFGLIKGRKRMNLLLRPTPPLPPDCGVPPVTIIIPAKDEGERIRDCLTSSLAQDYPEFRVIAVDDRSVDETGRVMDEVAKTSGEKLEIIHIREGDLPAGWTGKNNALHRAILHLDETRKENSQENSILIFVDSDVILEPDVVTATVQSLIDRPFDLISLFPALESHSFWESLLVPLCGGAISAMYVVALTNSPEHPNVAFGNGQFLAVRRSVYDALGGHESVKDKFCEDIVLARRCKVAGFKPRLALGEKFARVRMYSSLAGIVRGWGRIMYAGSEGSPWRMIAGIFFVFASIYSIVPAAIWGVWRQTHPIGPEKGEWILATVALHAVLMFTAVVAVYAWTRNPKRYVFLLPLGAAMLIAVFIKGIMNCMTGKIVWRGTHYSAAPRS